MFAKPYKLKSTNTLKNSEKKLLLQRIENAFPAAPQEKLRELVPAKAVTNCLRLVLPTEEVVGVYTVESAPLLIETEDSLLPALPTLWQVPSMLPAITIHAPVLSKIVSGVPLYLPGVVVPPHGVGFPMFPARALLAVRTTDNAAPALIARALMSSADMLMKTGGICVQILHVFGDQLFKDPKLCMAERPQLEPVPTGIVDSAELLASSISNLGLVSREQWPGLGLVSREQWPGLGLVSREQWPGLGLVSREQWPGLSRPQSAPSQPAHDPRIIHEGEHIPTQDDELNTSDAVCTDAVEPDEQAIPQDMDGLLRWCLLCFLRRDGKNLTLPLKTNLLYKNHLIPMCPSDRTLDVKKSTYKKMGKFLEAMQREGLLEVKEVEKGVDAVTAVSVCHPSVRGARPPRAAPRPRGPASRHYTPPAVREKLCVTAAVAPLFPNVKRGTALSPGEVRAALTQYVRAHALTASQPAHVCLDPLLAAVAGKQDQELVKWDALMASVQGRMTAATEMQWAGGETRLVKARLEPVAMSVATRSGNKKVTLVSNLEAYGFQLAALAQVCQHAAGAAAGVTRAPGAKHDQLMLQGDQTYFIVKLLVEKYGLPKKFVEGADKILAKKK